MKNVNEDQSDHDINLRKEAEAKALANQDQQAENIETMQPEDVKRILHELRVHQIELEMQNEELRRSQEELDASRELYFDLYDMAPVGYVTISLKGIIIQANLTSSGLLGVARSELLRQPLSRFIIPEDQGIYQRLRKLLLETGERQTCELRMSRENGDVFWGRIDAVADQKIGVETSCKVMLFDITERKKAEEEHKKHIEQDKFAAIGKVAGKMAHDFNNILGIIMGTSQLMQTYNAHSEYDDDIDIILESARRGRNLTKNLLLFAKDQEPRFKSFDLNDRIAVLIRALKSDLKDTEVDLNFGVGMENVYADAGLLENALVNLIQNSIHSMSKIDKPVLRIKTYSQDSDVRIELEDTGCGIPAECMENIFDIAFSLKGGNDKSGAYRRDISGSGYGLWNAKRSVEQHGGSISIESKVDKGTKIKITLPIIKEHSGGEALAKEHKHAVSKGKNILIVDDEPHMGKILHSLLSRFDHNITLAADGKTALNHIGKTAFDIISLDFILPDADGMEVYEKIRVKDKNVPVVFVSGNFKYIESMMDMKRKDPKVDHLAKPFNNADYVNMINKWLEKDIVEENEIRTDIHD